MGFNEFISKLFGNKATRDMKEIQPWVEKVKAVYPEISKLTNDELRQIIGPHSVIPYPTVYGKSRLLSSLSTS